MIEESPKLLKQDSLINIQVQTGHEQYADALQYTEYHGDLAVVVSTPLQAICSVTIISSSNPEHIGHTIDIFREDLEFALDNATYGRYNKRLMTIADRHEKVIYYSSDYDFATQFYKKVKSGLGNNSLPNRSFRTILEAREKYTDDYRYVLIEDIATWEDIEDEEPELDEEKDA